MDRAEEAQGEGEAHLGSEGRPNLANGQRIRISPSSSSSMPPSPSFFLVPSSSEKTAGPTGWGPLGEKLEGRRSAVLSRPTSAAAVTCSRRNTTITTTSSSSSSGMTAEGSVIERSAL